MTEDAERQSILDSEHLKLLSWGYFVLGGISVFTSLFFALYILMGVTVAGIGAFDSDAAEQGIAMMGGFLVLFGGVLFVLTAGLGSLKIYAGVCIRKRQKRTLCQVAAGLSVISIPLGTILGVLTFMVLERPTVKEEFSAAP